MDKIEAIRIHPTFQTALKEINEIEKKRIFCKHGFNHLQDTARIMYIINFEESLGVEKDIIYATALLHDIGRAKEYKDGTPHNEVGAVIAKEILKDTAFAEEEILAIVDAVLGHRQKSNEELYSPLKYLLKKADDLSRDCFDCKAQKECYWSDERKNHQFSI